MQKNLAPHQACAACKHQRKRCGPECVLAPYFTQQNSHNFQAVHKVFGVANVTKLIRSLGTPEQRQKAMQSLIWEAECRQRDPVLGCWGKYNELYNRYAALERHVAQGMIYNAKQEMNRWNTNMSIEHPLPYMDSGENLLLEPAYRDATFNQSYNYQDQLNPMNPMNGMAMENHILFDGGS